MSYKDIACKKEVKQISMRACVYGIKTKDNRRNFTCIKLLTIT